MDQVVKTRILLDIVAQLDALQDIATKTLECGGFGRELVAVKLLVDEFGDLNRVMRRGLEALNDN